MINDVTPLFTTFLPAACAGTLTAFVTACAISAQFAVDSTWPLRWSFTGSLAPGAELTVTFRVKVDQQRANGKVIARFPLGTQRRFGQLKSGK